MNEPNPIATDRVDSIDYIPAEAKRRAALSHSRENWSRPLQKIATGIDGFEHISRGGLVEGRTALIVGTSGSGQNAVFNGSLSTEQFNNMDVQRSSLPLRNGPKTSCETSKRLVGTSTA